MKEASGECLGFLTMIPEKIALCCVASYPGLPYSDFVLCVAGLDTKVTAVFAATCEHQTLPAFRLQKAVAPQVHPFYAMVGGSFV